MKEIKEAIQESINHDTIVHLTVSAADIYEAMEGAVIRGCLSRPH